MRRKLAIAFDHSASLRVIPSPGLCGQAPLVQLTGKAGRWQCPDEGPMEVAIVLGAATVSRSLGFGRRLEDRNHFALARFKEGCPVVICDRSDAPGRGHREPWVVSSSPGLVVGSSCVEAGAGAGGSRAWGDRHGESI